MLEPSIPSRVEREETLNTPLWGGLADTDVQRDLFHRGSKHSSSSSSRGECQHSRPGRSGEGRKEPKAYHLRTHRQPRRSTPTAMPHHQELATAAAAAVGGWVGGTKEMGGNQRNGVIMLHRDTSTPEPGVRSLEPGGRYLATPAAAVLWLRLEG